MLYEKAELCTPRQIFSGAASIAGGIILTLSLLRAAQNAHLAWSPTATARECFPFIENRETPTAESVSRLLLSALFFGNDSFYFDGGDENTGTSDSIINPSGDADEDLPEAPIGEPIGNGDEDIYAYDYSLLPQGYTALLPYDLSRNPEPGEILLSNATGYDIDVPALASADYPIKTNLSSVNSEKPLVLIIHTHGTEAYSPEGAKFISPGAVHRSSDTSENMIAVGKVMAEILNESGIPTLHCEIMHDLESYQHSYDLAADTIQKYLSEYPSIKYVFDVHRDAIVGKDGAMIRPITLINGEKSAQVMLLVGTNEKGADHPDWEGNFIVAAKLQKRLTTAYNRFARPINIRGASFNEQFTPGSLLIEIGSAANTLSEAKAAARHLTYSIARMIIEESN